LGKLLELAPPGFGLPGGTAETLLADAGVVFFPPADVVDAVVVVVVVAASFLVIDSVPDGC